MLALALALALALGAGTEHEYRAPALSTRASKGAQRQAARAGAEGFRGAPPLGAAPSVDRPPGHAGHHTAQPRPGPRRPLLVPQSRWQQQRQRFRRPRRSLPREEAEKPPQAALVPEAEVSGEEEGAEEERRTRERDEERGGERG